MPVLDGKLRNSSIAASNPPAEPPMPTIRQFEFLLADVDPDFLLWAFDCEDFVLRLFACEKYARLFAVRLAAIMALCMLVPSRTSYKLHSLIASAVSSRGLRNR
jgi:hypothetical protein